VFELRFAHWRHSLHYKPRGVGPETADCSLFVRHFYQDQAPRISPTVVSGKNFTIDRHVSHAVLSSISPSIPNLIGQLCYSARSGSVGQIVDTPKFAIMKRQDGRKPAPASVINPLLGRRNTDETREAAGNPGSYRYFVDDSSFW